MEVSCLPTRLIVVFCHWLRPCSCLHSKTCDSIGRFFSERSFQKRGRSFQKRGRSQGHQQRNETKIVFGFLILKMFPPSQTVFVFNQWSFLFLETKFSKTWTFPRGQKKERNQNRSRFFDFENVSSFTNRVGFPPIVVFFPKQSFQKRGHSQ